MLYYSESERGFYDNNIHESMPADAIEITVKERENLLKGESAGKVITIMDGHPSLADPQTPSATIRRERQLYDIDIAAGAARLRYVSAGQLIEEEYRQALHAVQAWRAAGNPADVVPPEIISGAEYSGITYEQAAVEIEQTAEQWESVLSAIRDLRLGGKADIKAAADDQIEAVAAGYIEQLGAMAPV